MSAGRADLALFTSEVYDKAVIRRIRLSRLAQKQLRKLPRHIVLKLQTWVEIVEFEGLENARKIPGFHDEALKGQRVGQRSVRLSRSYRAIYEIRQDLTSELVSVEEVNKHEY